MTDSAQIESLQLANAGMVEAFTRECKRSGESQWEAIRVLNEIYGGFSVANPNYTPNALQLLALGRCYVRALIADNPTRLTPDEWARTRCHANHLLNLIEVSSGPMTLAVESDGYTHS